MALTNIIVIVVVILMFIAMFIEIAHPAVIAFITLIFFFLIGYVTPDEIMSSIANEGVLTLALLFIVASVIERTNMIEKILYYILAKSKSEKSALLRLTSPLIGLSAFFNNTPIVVMMIPAIQSWCSERDLYASKLLLPISYATIFGGMFTIIGTSTNLIVHGWLLENGFDGFTFFHLFPYAIIGVIFGVLYLYFIGYRMLPENNTAISKRYDDGKRFLYEAVVNDDCSLIGKTVTSPEFQKLHDLYLVKIVRGDQIISPIKISDKIENGDELVFTGTIEGLESLETLEGMSIKTAPDMSVDSLQTDDAKLVEGIVSHNSSIIYQRVKHSNFRNKYDASIVAVHRKNENIEENVGDIILRPGDVLLLLVGEDFEKSAYKNNDFYLLADIPKKQTMSKKQIIVSAVGFVSMIVSVAIGILSMFEAAILCLALFALFDLLDTVRVKRSLSLKVLLLIVSSLAIGKVIETTGTAELIADTIITVVGSNFGVIGLLVSIYLMTNILTEIITNTAAAVIVLPIAVQVATHLEIAPTSAAVIVAIAASASFSTPIGYQTNLLVYGPGGYNFTDYVKVGLPLNIIFMFTTIASVYVLT